MSSTPPRSVFGIPIVESDHLPIEPDQRTITRRIVRHTLADWLRYIGEDPGPRPHDAIEMILTNHAGHQIIYSSRGVLTSLTEYARTVCTHPVNPLS